MAISDAAPTRSPGGMLCFEDLRAYLRYLDGRGDVLRFPQPVATLDEMGAVIARCDYENVDKALLFERPADRDLPVLANTLGAHQRRVADLFGVPVGAPLLGAIAQNLGRVMQQGGIPPRMVPREAAPCKEIVLTGEEASLDRIPILRLNPGDGQGPMSDQGRFISSMVVCKHGPDNHNLSYHRLEQQEPHTGSIWIFSGTQDAALGFEKWPRGESLEFAYALGVSPEFLLFAANPALPRDKDDYAFLGGLRGAPVDLVQCETIDCAVPASAEIVVEGICRPENWGTQGRYASFNGFYDRERRRPTFEVTAITMRRNAMYQHVHIGLGLNECNNLAAIGRSVRLFLALKDVSPNVTDVFVQPEAGCGFTAHIGLNKKVLGEPRLVMMRAYTALMGFLKHCFVHDADIDLRDARDRDWSVAHRMIPDRDLLIIPNVKGMPIEPLAQGEFGSPARLGAYDGHLELPFGLRTFMGVDCTTPMGVQVDERVVMPPALRQRADAILQEALRK